MSFHKEGECRGISAKPTSIKKGKDIPKLPENYKKLYQYFIYHYFPLMENLFDYLFMLLFIVSARE